MSVPSKLSSLQPKDFLFNHKPLAPLIVAAGTDNEAKVQTHKCFVSHENQPLGLGVYFPDSNFEQSNGVINDEKTELHVMMDKKDYNILSEATARYYKRTMLGSDQPIASGFRGGVISIPNLSQNDPRRILDWS